MNPNPDTTEIDVTDDGEVIVEPGYLAYLRSHGYRIVDVDKVRFIASSSRDITHICCIVTTHEYPWGHEKLDVAAHKVELPVCSCEDFQYNKSVDVSDTLLATEKPTHCKHLSNSYRELNAEDDSQETL